MVIGKETSSIKFYRLFTNNCLKSSKGFTLVELIVVFAIIVVLATFSISAFGSFREKAKIARCIAEINGLGKDLNAYAIDKGSYPAEATWLNDIGRASLVDPWGSPYYYRPFNPLTSPDDMRQIAGLWNTDYDLYSKGQDGQTDLSFNDPRSKDDIVRFSDGSYTDLVSNF
ncbi:MAG: type II secretion system protein GspG [Geobacteraceae bacterium]|nr:type II secretion system protein GspG [Geobacteraceae bacterium]